MRGFSPVRRSSSGSFTGATSGPSGRSRCRSRVRFRVSALVTVPGLAGATRQDILRAYGKIQPYVRRTPVIEIDGADFGLEACRIVLKLELLQHAGSFKARGAFANLLLREIPDAGVVAASGGNHGVAVAFAAQRLGKPARIFVPSVASAAKVARIREYGAQL